MCRFVPAVTVDVRAVEAHGAARGAIEPARAPAWVLALVAAVALGALLALVAVLAR